MGGQLSKTATGYKQCRVMAAFETSEVVGTVRHDPPPESRLNRRGFLSAAGSVLIASTTPIWAASPAILSKVTATRSVHLHSTRIGERLRADYWIEGEYIPEMLASISHFLRDWRASKSISYDPRAIDLLSAAHTRLETIEPFEVLSGYRTPETNAMLRRQSRGVAKSSYHMRGMAVDVTLKSRSVDQMYRAALACAAGGVGRYSRSHFVHMDCGPVRFWGR